MTTWTSGGGAVVLSTARASNAHTKVQIQDPEKCLLIMWRHLFMGASCWDAVMALALVEVERRTSLGGTFAM